MQIQPISQTNNFKRKFMPIPPKMYKNGVPTHVPGCGPFFNADENSFGQIKNFIFGLFRNK